MNLNGMITKGYSAEEFVDLFEQNSYRLCAGAVVKLGRVVEMQTEDNCQVHGFPVPLQSPCANSGFVTIWKRYMQYKKKNTRARNFTFLLEACFLGLFLGSFLSIPVFSPAGPYLPCGIVPKTKHPKPRFFHLQWVEQKNYSSPFQSIQLC